MSRGRGEALECGSRTPKLSLPSSYGSAFCLLLILVLAACRPQQKMADQPKYDPLEASTFFSDGFASRPRVPGTIPYQGWKSDSVLHTGKSAGVLVDQIPLDISDDFMKRGEERFSIYCSMCHGRGGYGDGMIVQRGYRRPTSFHTADLRTKKDGHIFDVITNGYGAMPKYGPMIPVQDRWAIVAHVRALQFSQNAVLGDLTSAEQSRFSGGGKK